MNDFPEPSDELSAYLAGKLDDDATTAFEARLRDDEALRAQLEQERALAERFATMAPPAPAGTAARLRERLARERDLLAGDPPAVADAAGPATRFAPASLAGARGRRRPGWVRWSAVGSVAAALVAVAVVGAGVLSGGFGGSTDTVADSDSSTETTAREFLDDEPQEDMAATDTEQAPSAMAAPDEQAQLDDADTDGGAPRTLQPEVVDEAVALVGEAEVAAHLSDRPEVAGLLGTAPDEAADLGAAFTVAVRGAETFADGTRPDACLDSISEGTAGPVVPARVERLLFDGAPALAYVLVTAPGAETSLQRVEAWIVDTAGCGVRLFLVLPS